MKPSMNLSMNLSAAGFVLAAGAVALLPVNAAAAETDPVCNQLGREVALRAAEQMQAGLDTAARTELAAIAEAVCIEFTVPAATAAAAAGGNASAAAEAERTASNEADSERREAFGLEIIPPEERVRRPGLKRL